MRKFAWTILMILMVTALAACGDDTPSQEVPTTPDTGTPDVGTDTGQDVQEDVEQDVEEDVDVEPTEGVMDGTWTVTIKADQDGELIATLTLTHEAGAEVVNGTFALPNGTTGNLEATRWFEATQTFETSLHPDENDPNVRYQILEAGYNDDGNLEGRFLGHPDYDGFSNFVILERQ